MKKIPVILTIFVLTLCLGCREITPENQEVSRNLPEGYGAVRVSFKDAARTAMPDLDLAYEYIVYQDALRNESYTPLPTDGTIEIPAGNNYTIKVRAKLKNNSTADAVQQIIAEGASERFNIEAGKMNDKLIIITLIPVNYSESSFGSFEYSVNFGGLNVKIVSFYLQRISGDNVIELNMVPAGIERNIPAGYYLLQLTAEQLTAEDGAGSLAFRTKVVHIVPGAITKWDDTLTMADFIAGNFVTSNADDENIPGTLRYALDKASYGSTVHVMLPPGSVIILNKTLEVKKGVSIEGNGVTLMPAAEVDGFGLMEIGIILEEDPGENYIRRVHFTGGNADSGGAINNGSNLILVSCIFSNNKAVNGGAIYSTGTLFADGCTFYNNESELGGAIFGGQVLTIRGNIFYGNTKNSTIMVENPISNDGNNAVDSMESWFTGNDNLISSLPFSPKTFRVFQNSGLEMYDQFFENKFDFYGNPMTTANFYAGAVQEQVKSDGFYIGISFDSSMGNAGVKSPAPNEDGIYSGSVTIEAVPKEGNKFVEWQKIGNGEEEPVYNNIVYTFEVGEHIFLRAVFE